MSNDNVIIAGGGTGGHLVPSVVMGHYIQTHFNANITYVTGQKPLDYLFAKQHNLKQIVHLPIRSFSNQTFVQKMGTCVRLFKSTYSSIRLLRQKKASLIIGVGGYASAPTLMAALILRIPILLQEQNSYPGIVNRFFARFSKSILLGFENAVQHFIPRAQKKCVYTGNFSWPRLRHDQPVSCPHPMLLITGGSHGAQALNTAVAEHIDTLFSKCESLHIVWQCGTQNVDAISTQFAELITRKQLTLIGHTKNLFPTFLAADLCITRAGALSLFDVIHSETPALVVPFPHSTHNHQVANAQWLTHFGAAKLIQESDLFWQKTLIDTCILWLTEPTRRNAFVENLKLVKTRYPSLEVLNTVLTPYLRTKKQ